LDISRTRWRLGNKELSLLWKWADQNPNAMTDMERVQMPPITEYWKVLADDMDPSAGIEEEYHHKNDKVYCWKGLRFTARQDLEAFSRYTEQKIGGVVPTELLSNEVRNMLPKNSEKSKIKGVKKEEDGIASIVQAEDPTEETQAPASLTGLDETTPADAGTPMDFDTTPAANIDEEINVPEGSPLVDHVDIAAPGAVDITAEDTSASVPEEAVSPVPPAEATLEVLAGGQGSSPKIL
jgi:THO complex subunit 1